MAIQQIPSKAPRETQPSEPALGYLRSDCDRPCWPDPLRTSISALPTLDLDRDWMGLSGFHDGRCNHRSLRVLSGLFSGASLSGSIHHQYVAVSKPRVSFELWMLTGRSTTGGFCVVYFQVSWISASGADVAFGLQALVLGVAFVVGVVATQFLGNRFAEDVQVIKTSNIQ